jgi:copper(I)-binding protein
MTVKRIAGVFLVMLGLTASGHAQMTGSGGIVIEPGGCVCPMSAPSHTVTVEWPWARATPAGASSAVVYMTLVDRRTTDDRLLGASTPVAEKVELHSNTNDNGVMKMRQLPSILLHPGVEVALEPGATHMMLVGLKRTLKKGETFPLTLEFEQAGRIEVTVAVKGVGAMEPGSMEMQ